jgi:hypothetical protein
MEPGEEFANQTLELLRGAIDAWYRSDPEPYIAMWSRQEPVSLFDALGRCKAAWPELETTFWRMASRFSEPEINTEFDVVCVGPKIANTVGYKQGQVAIDGISQPVRIRATQIHRREQDEQELVHRHGDFVPDQRAPVKIGPDPHADSPVTPIASECRQVAAQ